MPLFGRNSANSTQTSPAVHHDTVAEEPNRRSGGGVFGRHRTTDPAVDHPTTTDTNGHHGGLFGRHHTTDPAVNYPTTTNTNGHHGGLFHRNAEDPSILAARERVMSAEAAERDADKALHNARMAVREARDHVKRLEREAAEE
jgi:hypothetical protein